ncbi:hypothetical protein BD311DRAFT_756148 [Dichomitus squalens]|uniref:Uncharacterized protein n=1 Tax=Dichomitus squalens TaxID=114155 RepID=A0A4Q9MPN2_9APHY|nr:hypothetical protein BD311DRAFT_756148 [Dichomitus squalens]
MVSSSTASTQGSATPSSLAGTIVTRSHHLEVVSRSFWTTAVVYATCRLKVSCATLASCVVGPCDYLQMVLVGIKAIYILQHRFVFATSTRYDVIAFDASHLCHIYAYRQSNPVSQAE